jgi:replicative DNA helicase
MIDTAAADKALGILVPEKFYSESHRRIFEAIAALHVTGQPVDVVQVATWLRDRERLPQIGGMAYLTEVLNTAPAVANVEAYAETVSKKYQLRQMIVACQRITAQGYAGVGDATDFIDGAEQAVFEVARASSTRPRLRPLIDTVRARFKVWGDHYKRLSDGTVRAGEVIGLSTGLDAFDMAIGGLQDGDVTVVAARPGMGKSILGVDVAIHVAGYTDADGRRPHVAGMFSLEMPKEQIGDRAICSRAGVNLNNLRTGTFTPADWGKMTAATSAYARLDQFYLDDTPALTLMQIRSMARELAADLAREPETTRRRLRVLVVDYLQLVEASTGTDSREQAVSSVSRGLKQLAKDLHIPVIALAQLNRGVEARQDKRPGLADLRESGAIEQDADNVVFIYRDEYYNADTADKGVAELIIAKQRNGSCGTVRVGFDGALSRFYNLSPEPEPYHDECR